MVDTKQNICKQAIKLFNDKGYDNVSLREIAQAAGTTIGNLTYHYPHKENLIAAIQDDLHTGFIENLNANKSGEELLKSIILLFIEAQKRRDENSFYYKNIIELCKNSKVIAKSNIDFRENLFNYFTSCFTQLKENRIMRSDISQKQYETLAYLIILMTTLWIQNASPYYDQSLPTISLLDALLDVIFPYLTCDGVKCYSALCEEFTHHNKF